MSFILDALKKAEAERQRQTGPTLLEVRVTQPRRRFPLWILIISGLLAVNILLLIVFVVRRPALSGASTEQPAVAASRAGKRECASAAAPAGPCSRRRRNSRAGSQPQRHRQASRCRCPAPRHPPRGGRSAGRASHGQSR